MSYTIKHDEWTYDGVNPVYIDDVVGIMVELYRENGGVKLLGSSTSYIDNDNVYYYDLACNSFANRAWNNVYGNYDDIFDDNGEVYIDIEISQWFIDHAKQMLDIDDKCMDIAYNAFKDYNGTYTSDDIRKPISNYIKDNDIADVDTDDVLYVAASAGMIMYNYVANNGTYNICV